MSLRALTLTIWLLLVVAMGTAWAVVPPFTSLPLGWDRAPQHGTNITYVLKWGNLPGATNYSLNVGTNLTAVVTNPTAGYLYFHVVARTPDGLESEPSNTVIETNYPARPLDLRFGTNKTTSSLRIEGTTDGDNWILLGTVTQLQRPVTIPATGKQLLIRAKTVVPPPPLPQ